MSLVLQYHSSLLSAQSGLFQIDPGMDVHNPHLEKLRSRKRKDKKGKAPWNSTDDDVPNATFETRQGDIALSLAAVAPPPSALSDQTPRRVMVDVSARQGNIDIVVVSWLGMFSRLRADGRCSSRSTPGVISISR